KSTFPKIQSKPKNKKLDEELGEKAALESLLYEDGKDFQEQLKLVPLETKLMCVVGRAVPIHEEPEETSSRSHKEDGVTGKSGGRITAKMIKALAKENV
ncbi:CCD83 protein, partial [Heliornis fulica]|nr:CCD83 protein [Heliornis fulica]